MRSDGYPKDVRDRICGCLTDVRWMSEMDFGHPWDAIKHVQIPHGITTVAVPMAGRIEALGRSMDVRGRMSGI